MGSGRDVARLLTDGGGGNAVVDDVSELSPPGAAGGFDVAEAESEIGVSFVDCNTDEGVAIVDPDLRDVAGVISNRDGVPNEGCERRGEVALALEVNAIALNDAILRNS